MEGKIKYIKNYKILDIIGQGSFGQVYKAQAEDADKIVALKIITKIGRSSEEIKNLKQESEIHRKLDHPNIIQLISSFETEKQLVFVCEYALSDLHKLLSKVKSFKEHRAQKITFDLVSALYYLHSHRILHRDLKPPNILLDQNYRAKLCDFGLSRNMTASTDIAKSIKGTPLYMAPELLKSRGYGHEADLWSLGCIIYEMLAGELPFNAKTYPELMRELEETTVIKCSDDWSRDCVSFLQGLLVINPQERASWDKIVEHPFVKGNILILEKDQVSSSPFTKPSKIDVRLETKEVGKMSETNVKNQAKKNSFSLISPDQEPALDTTRKTEHLNLTFQPGGVHNIHKFQMQEPIRTHQAVNFQPVAENSNMVMHRLMDECDFFNYFATPPIKKLAAPEENKDFKSDEINQNSFISHGKHNSDGMSTETSSIPVETEEWLQFLFKSMQEILDGDLDIYKQNNMMNLIVGLLRTSKINFKLINYVVQIICLPYAIDAPQSLLIEIDKLYLQMKLVPNLIFASTKLCSRKLGHDSMEVFSIPKVDKIVEFTANELKTLSGIYDAVVYLVHSNEAFIVMLCDTILIMNDYYSFRSFILSGINDSNSKDAVRLTGSIIALVCAIIQDIPENAKVVEGIVFHNDVNFCQLLQHKEAKIKIRSCQMIRLLGRFRCSLLKKAWSDELSKSLTSLIGDENSDVRRESAALLEEFKDCIGWFKCLNSTE